MRRHNLAVPLLLLSLGNAQPQVRLGAQYSLSPEMQAGVITALDVTIGVEADQSGRTVIDWPDQWAGEQHLGQWAHDITVEGAMRTEPAPHGGRIIYSTPRAPLVMRYRVLSAYEADPDVDNSEQPKPVIRPHWFYAVGFSLYARPAGRETMPAQFIWRGAPGIGFASDTENVRGLHGKLRTIKDISESVAIGGSDLYVSSGRVGGDAVRIAHVGRFGFDTRAFEGLARKIIATERTFWRDRRAGPFLITAVPLNSRPQQTGFSGTGLGDAFATWIARDKSLDDLTWFLAHEYFHSWNPGQLGHTDDATEAQGYWFSEGFTDFYARRLMLRAGLLTPQHFVSEWNAALHNYAVSPYRSTRNAEAARQFWKDPRARMLPYQRGAMLAAIWDQRLRHISHGKVSLDAVMRDQREQTAGSDVAPSPVDAFVYAAAQHNLDVRNDIARYLDQGSLIVLPPDAFGACAHVVTQTSPVFERGWDTEATMRNGDIVTGLDPGTRAYAAGLRNGMKLLVQSGGGEGDPDAVIRLEVQDNQIRRSIAFEPMGHTFVDVQIIQLDAARFASNPAGCRIALSG